MRITEAVEEKNKAIEELNENKRIITEKDEKIRKLQDLLSQIKIQIEGIQSDHTREVIRYKSEIQNLQKELDNYTKSKHQVTSTISELQSDLRDV